MRQILSRSLLTVAAASSILAVTGGHADADADARGGAVGSPGVLSGNTVQAPVDVPVNVCGNTVDVAAAGNAAFGNSCDNESRARHARDAAGSADTAGSAGSAELGAPAGSGGPGGPGASGQQKVGGSPGVLSGNSVDIPVEAPVNACGNSVDAGALLNPAMGNSCANAEDSSVSAPRPPSVPPGPTPGGPPHTPPGNPSDTPPGTSPGKPPAQHRSPHAPVTRRVAEPELAATGASGRQAGAVGATGAVLLLGGAILYRRARPGAPAAARMR